MTRRREPQLNRRQRGFAKRKPERLALPGLHWTYGSVVAAGRPIDVMLDELKELWEVRHNPGALRDALVLCSELCDPPIPLPSWAATALDRSLMTGDMPARWTAYTRDLLDVDRFDLFELAHAYGLTRTEAAEFVADAERADGRRTTASAVLRLSTDVPRRAAQNPGRYYRAASCPPMDSRLEHWDEALRRAQGRLNARRPNALFLFHREPRTPSRKK